jgi:hypothetical protein
MLCNVAGAFSAKQTSVFYMKRVTCSIAAIVLILAAASVRGPVSAATADPHAYFNSLLARSDYWKSYALRDDAELLSYRASKVKRAWVTYDAVLDAAKVLIPVFNPDAGTSITTALDRTATTLTFANSVAGLNNLRALKIDDEIMVISGNKVSQGSSISVLRGQHGTTAAPHAASSPVYFSTNSLMNIVKLPLGTEDGHSYVFTWDTLWTPSWMGLNYNLKTFQFTNNDSLWLQVDTRMNGVTGNNRHTDSFDAARDVAAVGGRYLPVCCGPAIWDPANSGQAGPNVTVVSQIEPQTGAFVVAPNRWTRYWVQINQRPNDYDQMSMWVADETHAAVKVFDQLQLSVRPGGTRPNSIDAFWLEFNTSANALPEGRGELTAYMRNFVALRDVADVRTLLQQPNTSGIVGPMPPTNLRIVR